MCIKEKGMKVERMIRCIFYIIHVVLLIIGRTINAEIWPLPLVIVLITVLIIFLIYDVYLLIKKQ